MQPNAIPPSVPFSVDKFLSTAGHGRRMVVLQHRFKLFLQGEPSDALFYIISGIIKLSHLSQSGKEATIPPLNAGCFAGEESLDTMQPIRMTTAIAVSDCELMRIDLSEMKRVLRDESSMSEHFLLSVLRSSTQMKDTLIDQLSNNIERRLARTLLLLAGDKGTGSLESFIPQMSQEALASMIGCSRPRVNFFLKRFRTLGLIKYNGVIHVSPALRDLLE